MGQRVGRLGADRAAARVEADSLVAARELLEHLRQLEIDPDITGMPLLGGSSTDSARVRSPAASRPVPSNCRLIGAELVIIRLLCDCLKRGQPGRHVGLIEGDPQLVAPGVGVSDAGGFAQPGRSGGVGRSPRRIAAQSSSAPARASATEGGRALIFAPASAGGRTARSIPASRKASA